MAFNNEIERVKAQIFLLEKKLALLEEIEKQPQTLFDVIRNLGYSVDACYEIVDAVEEFEKSKEVEKLQEKEWNVVRESVKWCEEHPDKDPLDCLKPQTPEETERGLKEAFHEAVKQGVVSSHTKPETLYDICMTWWERVFGNTDDTETCIDDLVDNIDYWLPKEQSAAGSQNAYVESAVEGYNDAINKIRRKLR